MSTRALNELFAKPAGDVPAADDARAIALEMASRLGDATVVPASVRALGGGVAFLADKGREEQLVVVCPQDSKPGWRADFTGQSGQGEGLDILVADPRSRNLRVLAGMLPGAIPRPLGTQASFGFGDRLGLATTGHASALAPYAKDIKPIFCQQSIREMERTDRSAAQVMDDALRGAFRAGWVGECGADADHLKTFEDVDLTAAEGFVFFTIDPSDHVDQQVDDNTAGQVEEKFQALLDDKVESAGDFLTLYKGQSYTLETQEGSTVATLEEMSLKRAAVKYGRALAHIHAMAQHIEKVMGDRPWEIEVSVDETEQPTSVAEHLFIALELKRRGVPVASLAPRFVGQFEKGVDFIGDVSGLRQTMSQHAAIARQFGPYKLSLHSGSDKFSVYPYLGELSKGIYHVKTAGTSYLEALRVVARVEPEFFRDIVSFCRDRYETDRATYHVSARLHMAEGPAALSPEEMENMYLCEDPGRQILHVTFGSVLTTEHPDGTLMFKGQLMDILESNRSLYDEMLTLHFTRHLRPLIERASA